MLRFLIASFLGTLALPACAGAQCVLTGAANISRVRIEPRGAPAFDVELVDHAASVAPLDGSRVRVESAGPLSWSGTAEPSHVSVHLARELRLPGITLRPSVPVSRLRLPQHGDPVVDAQLAEGVWLREAEVPCDQLGLEWTSTLPTLPEGPTRGDVRPRAQELRVHAEPDGPAVLLELERPTSLLLARTERRGPWLRVRRELASGASIDGWVHASSVQIVQEQSLGDAGLAGGVVGFGCGSGTPPNVYRGPATLLAGAEVRTAPDGVAWAVARADVEVHVAMAHGAAWAKIERVRGMRSPNRLCGASLEFAYVPRSALRLPPGTP
ncbi:MAG TPA: hypothetical protein VIL20_23035 [Sandaracinaceae bacterium]